MLIVRHFNQMHVRHISVTYALQHSNSSSGKFRAHNINIMHTPNHNDEITNKISFTISDRRITANTMDYWLTVISIYPFPIIVIISPLREIPSRLADASSL
jgi:hypothetical protein